MAEFVLDGMMGSETFQGFTCEHHWSEAMSWYRSINRIYEKVSYLPKPVDGLKESETQTDSVYPAFNEAVTHNNC